MLFRTVGNNHLNGNIPNTIGNLKELRYLYVIEGFEYYFDNYLIFYRKLDYNDFSGNIPIEICNMENIQYL